MNEAAAIAQKGLDQAWRFNIFRRPSTKLRRLEEAADQLDRLDPQLEKAGEIVRQTCRGRTTTHQLRMMRGYLDCVKTQSLAGTSGLAQVALTMVLLAPEENRYEVAQRGLEGLKKVTSQPLLDCLPSTGRAQQVLTALSQIEEPVAQVLEVAEQLSRPEREVYLDSYASQVGQPDLSIQAARIGQEKHPVLEMLRQDET